MAVSNVAWQPLQLPPSSGLPLLLVSAELGPSCYTVRVTDMANIWTERLERKAICMRGWSEDTSLDPSDTPENMAKFLASLKTALDSRDPGHDKTTLDLICGSASEAGDDGLTLRVSCPLAGFAPLKWPFHLAKDPSSSIATNLVVPLFQAHNAKKRQVDSLLQMMSYKDAVVSKLADKVEAMGLGLEHVFAVPSGKGKATRAQAESKVKGFARFDRQKWEDDVNTKGQDLFEAASLDESNMMKLDESPALDNWWSGINTTVHITHSNMQPGHSTKPAKPDGTRTAGNEVREDDDFQVQTTPPGLTGRSHKVSAAAIDDTSTADEDEDIVPDSNPPNIHPTESTSRPRIGQLASRPRAAVDERQESATLSQQSLDSTADKGNDRPVSQEKAMAFRDKTATAGDDDATASETDSSHASPQPETTKPATRLGALGMIGGLESRNKATKDKADTSTGAVQQRTEAAPPRQARLGTIGGLGGLVSDSKTEQGDNSRGRTIQSDKTETAGQEARETSQERANRRREELKRDLERKAAAGPSKKKRRF